MRDSSRSKLGEESQWKLTVLLFEVSGRQALVTSVHGDGSCADGGLECQLASGHRSSPESQEVRRVLDSQLPFRVSPGDRWEWRTRHLKKIFNSEGGDQS